MQNCGRTLILDLDQTCINTWIDPVFLHELERTPDLKEKFAINQPQGIGFTFRLGGHLYFGLKRPYLREFLAFAHRYFDHILVWSAGQSEYVNEVCKAIFLRDGFPIPRVIWSRPHCDYHRQEKFYHKPLRKLIFDQGERNFCMDLRRTLILDDRLYTFCDNPENGVLIPGWFDQNENNVTIDQLLDRTSDVALLQFIQWLRRPEVVMAENYMILPKDRIFT